jgi:hypothetical protein
VISFRESLHSHHESGLSSLSRRLLEARGYRVLQVRHDEFPSKFDAVAKTRLLLAKMQMLLVNQ